MGYYSNMIKWKWFIVEGILLFLLGIFAIARPGIAAEALVELFGWLLIFLGALSLFGGVTSQCLVHENLFHWLVVSLPLSLD